LSRHDYDGERTHTHEPHTKETHTRRTTRTKSTCRSIRERNKDPNKYKRETHAYYTICYTPLPRPTVTASWTSSSWFLLPPTNGLRIGLKGLGRVPRALALCPLGPGRSRSRGIRNERCLDASTAQKTWYSCTTMQKTLAPCTSSLKHIKLYAQYAVNFQGGPCKGRAGQC
jgi:hypothetical protein